MALNNKQRLNRRQTVPGILVFKGACMSSVCRCAAISPLGGKPLDICRYNSGEEAIDDKAKCVIGNPINKGMIRKAKRRLRRNKAGIAGLERKRYIPASDPLSFLSVVGGPILPP